MQLLLQFIPDKFCLVIAYNKILLFTIWVIYNDAWFSIKLIWLLTSF